MTCLFLPYFKFYIRVKARGLGALLGEEKSWGSRRGACLSRQEGRQASIGGGRAGACRKICVGIFVGRALFFEMFVYFCLLIFVMKAHGKIDRRAYC